MTFQTASNMAYQPCDSYFVESHENGASAVKADAVEHAKLAARHRQDLIAGELSRQACDEYMEDILRHMRAMEVIFHIISGSPRANFT